MKKDWQFFISKLAKLESASLPNCKKRSSNETIKISLTYKVAFPNAKTTSNNYKLFVFNFEKSLKTIFHFAPIYLNTEAPKEINLMCN